MVRLDQAGANSYLERSDFAEMPSSALTLELVVQATPAIQPYALFSYAVAGSTNELLLIPDVAMSRLNILIKGEVVETTVAPSELHDGSLHRLLLTLDSGQGALGLCIDGALLRSESGVSVARNALTPGGTLIFGQDQDGSVPGRGFDPDQAYHGAVGDIRLFDTVRSVEEIVTHMLRPLADPPALLVAEWKFDEAFPGGQAALTAPLEMRGDIEVERHAALEGMAGDDVLRGGASEDTLSGGAGQDIPTGGEGADSFVLALGMAADRVTDFELGIDSLDMSGLLAAERDAVVYAENTAGDRVVLLSDGSSLTLTGVPLNAEPTGTVTVSGTLIVGSTLTADTSTVQDPDGIDSTTATVQWQRGGVDIPGATSTT